MRVVGAAGFVRFAHTEAGTAAPSIDAAKRAGGGGGGAGGGRGGGGGGGGGALAETLAR